MACRIWPLPCILEEHHMHWSPDACVGCWICSLQTCLNCDLQLLTAPLLKLQNVTSYIFVELWGHLERHLNLFFYCFKVVWEPMWCSGNSVELEPGDLGSNSLSVYELTGWLRTSHFPSAKPTSQGCYEDKKRRGECFKLFLGPSRRSRQDENEVI